MISYGSIIHAKLKQEAQKTPNERCKKYILKLLDRIKVDI